MHVTNSGEVVRLRMGAGLGWMLPAEVHVTDEHLLYRWRSESVPARAHPREQLLKRFVALAGAPAPAIERFAREWGVLAGGEPLAWLAPYAVGDKKVGLDEMLRPATLAPGQEEELTRPGGPRGALWYQEPLAIWRARAAAVAAVQRLSLRLEAGSRGDPRDWEALVQVTEEVTGHPRLPHLAGIGSQAPRNGPVLLSGVLTTWMRAAGLAMRFEWARPPKRPMLEILAGRSAWGGVVQALVTYLLGDEGRLVKCANPECSQILGKTESGRRRAFCATCRERYGDPGVTTRVERYRENKRRVRELRAEGHSLAEIAERLGFHDTRKRTAVERVEQLLAGQNGTSATTRRRKAPSRGK